MTRSRRILLLAIPLVGAIAIGGWLVGCANTIIPPAAPDAPTTVYLVDYGRHASLLLPDEDDQTLLEYAYGDWSWFAEDRDDWYRVFPVLLWPTDGALGRWEWPVDREAGEDYRHPLPCEVVHTIVVDEAAVRALRTDLAARYAAAAETPYFQPRYTLEFVHDPDAYHLLHNCNHVTAAWLRALGCRVRGSTMFSGWSVREVEDPDQPSP